MAGVRTALREMATEALMSMEAAYLQFIESKQGDNYLHKIRLKRVGPNKAGTPIKHPLDELGEEAVSLDEEGGAEDAYDYAAGW